MAREVSARELRTALPTVEALLEREGELIVTRDGRPVARLTPLTPRRRIPDHRKLRESLPRQERPSEELVREDREQR